MIQVIKGCLDLNLMTREKNTFHSERSEYAVAQRLGQGKSQTALFGKNRSYKGKKKKADMLSPRGL